MLGSVARGVLQHATCPVAVVHLADENARSAGAGVEGRA
ncbi:universal stress protein [Kribbella monticola]